MQDSLGESSINGGRRRTEEFNPFAKDASAQHRRRKDERERRESRRPAPPVDTPTQRPDDVKAELERKQREAIEKLEQQGDVSAPVVAPAPVPVHHEGPKIDDSQSVASLSREDRIAELRRKSEALKKTAPSAAGFWVQNSLKILNKVTTLAFCGDWACLTWLFLDRMCS